jgi:recombinational DNA repair ATPase RecF
MKTFQEFLTEGKIRRAKNEFKKAIKDFKREKKNKFKHNQALAKPTEPGSPERNKQLKLLNSQQGGQAGKIIQKRREIIQKLHSTFEKVMSRMEKKPKKQQKFSNKVQQKMNKINNKYDTSSNIPISGTD